MSLGVLSHLSVFTIFDVWDFCTKGCTCSFSLYVIPQGSDDTKTNSKAPCASSKCTLLSGTIPSCTFLLGRVHYPKITF